MDETTPATPNFNCDLFRGGDYISINSDCGDPFAQGYEIIHLINGAWGGHILSGRCQCQPELIENLAGGSEIWIHHIFH